MKLLALRTVCAMCGGSGFIPVSRAMLLVDKKQQLQPFRLYLPCWFCNALKATNPATPSLGRGSD